MHILREHCKEMAGSHPRNYCIIYPLCNSGEKDTIHYSGLGDRKEQIIVDSASRKAFYAARMSLLKHVPNSSSN